MKCKFAGLCLLALLGGCSSSHLVYVQETSLGVNLALSAEGMQKMSLGYDRDVYAIVPKKDDKQDAMSLFSVNKVKVEGMDNMHISEFVAAGKPAMKLAKDPNAISLIRNKVSGNE